MIIYKFIIITVVFIAHLQDGLLKSAPRTVLRVKQKE